VWLRVRSGLSAAGEVKSYMVKKKASKQKLVTVVTPIGYLTTTPAIAKKVASAAKKRAAKAPKRKRK
jgi:hypothetical protein